MARTFKLLRSLGEGAFGAVHLAEVRSDEGLVQTLAVKWLHPQWSQDPELATRLRDEARLLALLHHDSVVRVHGLTRIDGRLAILMEPVDGVDLSRLDTPVPAKAALELAEIVAEALDAAWTTVPPGQTEPLHCVHRDIKPSNVMITARGSVKVMDFGVAHASFDAREANTRSQQFGTARYMAPERWLHAQAQAPSDVFSLGVTLVEVVSGRPMERPRLSRQGFEEDVGAALLRLPEVLRPLVAAMLAFEPADRPGAAEVVARCRLLAQEAEGPTLKAWAATWVRQKKDERPRPPTGDTVVNEDRSADSVSFAVAGYEPTADFADVTGPAPTPRPLAPRSADLRPARALSPPPPMAPWWAWLTYGLLPFALGPLAFFSLGLLVQVLPTANTATPTAALSPSPSPNPSPGPSPSPSPSPLPATPAPSPSPVPEAPAPEAPAPEAPAPKIPVPTPVPATPTPQPPGPTPEPAPAAATTTVMLLFEPQDLAVSLPDGPARHRVWNTVPADRNLVVTVGTGASAWSCTIPVARTPTIWRIQADRQRCHQSS